MKWNIKAAAFTVALMWGGGMFFMGVSNMIWPGYGEAFLNVIGSVYPGYEPGSGWGSVLVGTGYAVVDGALGAALAAWVYNLVSGSESA